MANIIISQLEKKSFIVSIPLLALIISSFLAVLTSADANSGRTLCGSETYYKWIQSCLRGIRNDLPNITLSAESAARLFVQDGYNIGPWGTRLFANEFTDRAGGLMPDTPIRTDTKIEKTIVLFELNDANLKSGLDKIAEFKSQDNYVVVFARKSLIDSAKKSGADAVVYNHAAENGGLFQTSDKEWIIPTEPIANITAMWVWTGEFVAACTRLGKMPPMWQSFSVPGARERDAKYDGMKFHNDASIPIKAGKVGKEYISSLQNSISTLYMNDKNRIHDAASQAVISRNKGNKLFAFLAGHALEHSLSVPHEPGYFTKPARDWQDAKSAEDYKPGDFLLAIGYDRVYWDKKFDDFIRNLKQSGVKAAWSITTYNKEEAKGIPDTGIFINQRWSLGDSVVEVPGYDVKILPTSGVIAESILRMIEAEIFTIK